MILSSAVNGARQGAIGFCNPAGLYQYKVMAFGMKNSPATFERLINSVTSGIDGCDAYIDDAIIYSDI